MFLDGTDWGHSGTRKGPSNGLDSLRLKTGIWGSNETNGETANQGGLSWLQLGPTTILPPPNHQHFPAHVRTTRLLLNYA